MDPFSLTDMAKAVERLTQARDRGEKVLVFGDYDVDGISGTAILLNGLRRFGIAHCIYGLPSRLIEGYGLGSDHVTEAHFGGAGLIVTVDNGINAREAAQMACQLGIDIIVTDHHEIEGELPRAVAVVDPKREVPEHPGRNLSGAGVAFALVRALTGEAADLDLVALGTVADIVPLCGENRVLVALGLREMAEGRKVGIMRLAKAANLKPNEITAEKIAFQLGPRINAAGRLGEGDVALRLLMTDSESEADEMAAELDVANVERRRIEQEIHDEIVADLDQSFPEEQRTIVRAGRGWHAGVIGIVAARLLNRYHRPVILIAIDEDGLGRGSGRSTDTFNLVGALAACQSHLLRFGGHAAAAGLAVLEGEVAAFSEAFEQEARRHIMAEETAPLLEIDAMVGLSELDSQLVASLDRLEPFGCMNPAPLFCTHAATVMPNSFRILQGGHVRMALRQGSKIFQAVGFRMADRIPLDLDGRPVDIAFTPRFNTWRGETSIQLMLKDIRIV
jgi:single-stranded-DNA-specific exonuclease